MRDLRGINLDNYEAKLEQRTRKLTKLSRAKTEAHLKLVLKTNAKTLMMAENDMKLHEDYIAKKITMIQSCKEAIHPQTPQATRILRKLKEDEEHAAQLEAEYAERKLNPVSYFGAADEDDANVISFVTKRWANYGDQHSGHKDIPLSIKQQRFLVQLKALKIPITEKTSVLDNIKPIAEEKHSRLWTNLPHRMDGGTMGNQIRRENATIEDSPMIEIKHKALADSQKQETMYAWVGMDNKEQLEKATKLSGMWKKKNKKKSSENIETQTKEPST